MTIAPSNHRASFRHHDDHSALYWHLTAWSLAGLMALGAWLRLSGNDMLWMQAVHAVLPTLAGTWLWSCLTNLGLGWALVIVAMACDRHDGALIAALLPVFVLGSLVTHGFKQVLEVVRPASSDLANHLFVIGEPVFSANSMPSGHALTAGATALLLAWWAKNVFASLFLAAAAMLVAWSRVVVGAHWPADVVVGLALGAGVVGVVLAASQFKVVSRRLLGLRKKVASPIGQLSVACLEISSAMALAATRTGYPHGWPAVALLVSVAAVSGLWRCHRALKKNSL